MEFKVCQGVHVEIEFVLVRAVESICDVAGIRSADLSRLASVCVGEFSAGHVDETEPHVLWAGLHVSGVDVDWALSLAGTGFAPVICVTVVDIFSQSPNAQQQNT